MKPSTIAAGSRRAAIPTGTRPLTIIVDARCLQDPDYAPRGVGHHTLSLLQGTPRHAARRLVGLIDPAMPPLADAARAVFETLYGNAYAAAMAAEPGPAAFISLSPMTHDPLFAARLLDDASLLRASVVYDFIPRRDPARYLPRPADRLDYAVQLRWLAKNDLFCPISRSAADDLHALLRVPAGAIAITGAAVDPAFAQAAALRGPERRHILVVGGGDPRKNPETVIRAHAASALLQKKQVKLIVAGNYGPSHAAAFHAVAAALGGRADLLQVPGHLPQAELLALYGGARVLVCASRDEGFSLPVAEGMAAGAFVLASDIPAHAELVADPARRFPPDDHAALVTLMERAMTDRPWQVQALREQAAVWPDFLADEVAARFWTPLLARLDARGRHRPGPVPPGPAVHLVPPAPTRTLPGADQPHPAVLRGRRPRVALLSPLPPDRSGVADYTAATCPDLGEAVELHVFTETNAPTALRGAASVRPLDALPHLTARFDRVINVLGNSHFHLRIFAMMQRYGGAAIAHDARMLSFYRVLLGEERALAQAGSELGRTVARVELDAWMQDENTLPTLFLGEIAATAAPMVVHSHVTAAMMRARHGVEAAYVPFSIYRPWRAEELTPPRRLAARARLGLRPGEVVIATFGYVHPNKAPEECIWALEFLRAWGVNASLHFVGGVDNLADRGAGLLDLAARLGVGDAVRILGSFVSEQIYGDYLVGADLAIQLRTYRLGGLSGALLDCAAAGLACVTNASLAEAVGVPDGYTRSTPDVLNPLLIAEACAALIDAGASQTRREAERSAYSDARSFKVYARALCDALQLDVAAPKLHERNGHAA